MAKWIFGVLAAIVVAAGAVFGVFYIGTEAATVPLAQGFGPKPDIPAPNPTLVTTLNIAPAKGWSADGAPTPASGLKVTALARDLDHPRFVLGLPNGDVLVAEADAPPKPDDSKGVKGFVQKQVQKWAGSGERPSANRITLLRDADGDGVAETRTVLIEGLNSPFGMALQGDALYVADTDAILRFPYHAGDTKIIDKGVKVADLPAGGINHHWTKGVAVSPDGAKLYATVGSNSNVGENGIEAEANRADVLEIDAKTGAAHVFAAGLRNPNSPSWNPQSGALWVAVNERDELGSDLVPDYMTSVKEGAFYGWPYSYYGQHVDDRMKPQRPELVAKAIAPDYALGPHTASLGLVFNTGALFPAEYANGAFVGQHGSWNRRPRSGYEVLFVPFANGAPSGPPRSVLTGFLSSDGNALGRPVGVGMDAKGALLVADDVGNAVWRVSPAR